MPRKKKQDPFEKYEAVDSKIFWKIYKKNGNEKELMKVVDTGVTAIYYIDKEFLKGK
jgi:hypothetical protein